MSILIPTTQPNLELLTKTHLKQKIEERKRKSRNVDGAGSVLGEHKVDFSLNVNRTTTFSRNQITFGLSPNSPCRTVDKINLPGIYNN